MMVKKFFNTAGPVHRNNYVIDPLSRWDLEEVEFLLEQDKYFLLHAPRQSGKTSTLFALRDLINATSDDMIAIYVNVEAAQVARHEVHAGIKTIISRLGSEAAIILGQSEVEDELMSIFQKKAEGDALTASLTYLCKQTDKKVVLIIDEIDSLIGDTLVSVLRQLRAGYPDRMNRTFPTSVILCGLVDIKDYKIHKSDGEIITGGSCFNIKSKSLTLGNFSKEEIRSLYLQHTEETGQVFEEAVFDLAWCYTGGQPWLVNALAYQVCFEMKENRDRTRMITKEMFVEAKEQLILSRQTHLDQLGDKLKEKRVRDVIRPMLIGSNIDQDGENQRMESFAEVSQNELYCIDLGLIKRTPRGLMISNDIYKEVLPRELTDSLQTHMLTEFMEPEWLRSDGSMDVEKLLQMFRQFWRENSEIWTSQLPGYTEAAPHLVFQAFLQRVGNGHGQIEREYGLGMKRADLYLKWTSPVGEQRIIFELKLRRAREDSAAAFGKLKDDAFAQTAAYADTCGASESHVILFDRREGISWEEKLFTETKDGIKIWGL